MTSRWPSTSDLHARVHETFRLVLDAPELKSDDDYWDAGITSLGVMEIVSRLADDGIALSMSAVMEHATVLDVTRVASRDAAARPETAGAAGDDDGTLLPLAFNQRYRIGHSALPNGDFAPTLQPCAFVLRLVGRVDFAALEAAVQAVIRRHGALRVRYVQAGGRVWQIVQSSVDIRLARHDVRGHPPGTWTAIYRASLLAPFDLAVGPLLRGALLRVSADAWIFWMVFDHSIVDGVGAGLVADDVLSEYESRIGDPAAPLPPAPSYPAWVRRAAEEPWQRERAFWEQKVRTVNPFHAWIPYLPYGGAPDAPKARAVRRAWPSEDLKHLSREWQGRPHRTAVSLVTAYAIALHQVFGADPVVVFLEIANRAAPGQANLIASVTTELPIIVRFDAGPDLEAVTEAVSAELAEVLEHQYMPMAALIDLARSKAHNPDPHSAAITGGDFPIMSVNIARHGPPRRLAGCDLVATIIDPDVGAELPAWISGLALNVTLGDAGMAWRADYAPAQLAAGTVERVLRLTWQTLDDRSLLT